MSGYSGIWGFKLAKMLKAGLSVYGILLQLLLLGMRTSSSGVGRIDYLLWDLGLMRVSITQDVDFINARRH